MESADVELLRDLLKFNTSNPPGKEIYLLKYLQAKLENEKTGKKIDVFIQETAPERGNLVARLKGNGQKQPLLISSHVDVVPAQLSGWKHDPFSATIDDGYLYGRGTIDMKNFTAMSLSTMLRAKREKWPLKRDLIMSAVSDEERGGKFGMAQLVDKYPSLIQAEYAIGEVGGYTTYVDGHPIYPIQSGEKGVLWIKVKFRGKSGHGSMVTMNNVHWLLSDFLQELKTGVFPYHRTKTFQKFSHTLAKSLGIKGLRFYLLDSALGPLLLKKKVLKENSNLAHTILAMMTNTVNPTGISSGNSHNVVPSTVEVNLDCRTIPGVEPEVVIREIEKITGHKLDYEIVLRADGHETPTNTPLFDLICQKVQKHHPGSTPTPMLTVGYTDAGQLQKLGIKCYGFTPVKLEPNDQFTELYHGDNERIPLKGYLWGLNTFSDLIKEFCT